MKQIIAICISIGFLSCQNDKQLIEQIDAKNMTQEQIDSVLKGFEFEYESPIIIDSSDHVLIPISTKLLRNESSSSYYGYSDKHYSYDYWNVFFYNRKTHVTKLLTKKKLRISKIDAQEEEYEKGIQNKLKNKILYKVKDKDYNMDNFLNYKDPNFLFVSEIDGSGLKRISPPNETLQYYKVIPNTQQIIFSTFRDINTDSIFDNKDELIWYKTELLGNGEWKQEEIIDASNRKIIENLYFEQWLKKKE